jgi:beta-aspartyl-peptidase (threonine type)
VVRPGAIAHGGAGADAAHADGCRAAVDAALAELARTGDPLAAAVAGTMILEDDPRFNAGTGSIVRLDGSIQMDASVMDSGGRFGAVAGVERVRNPVLVARAVLDTPHLVLMGDGATRFAQALGHPDHDPATPHRRLATEAIKERIRQAAPDLPAFWRGSQWRQFWNYPLSPEALGLAGPERSEGTRLLQQQTPGPDQAGSDTVGVVVRASDGGFAAALSTGGNAIMLRGRVGDVPLYGAGLYASPAGAAAATGTGERITEALLAYTVVGWLAAGSGAQQAADRAVALLADKAVTGIVVATSTELAAAATRSMPWAAREADGPWMGPPSPSPPTPG